MPSSGGLGYDVIAAQIIATGIGKAERRAKDHENLGENCGDRATAPTVCHRRRVA
jgi:hypothetical protein